jgi:hypothetical protein
MKENRVMKAKRLKELISLIPDDEEVVLDNFYGNGELEISEEINDRPIPYLDTDSKNSESWSPWKVAYVIMGELKEEEE